MEISDKFCPVCKNRNERTALVCMHCGASLEDVIPGPTITALGPEAQTVDGSVIDLAVTIEDELIPADGFVVYIAGIDKRVSVRMQNEVILGRNADESNEPMFDLTELGGYPMGISRRHAKIRRTENGYEIVDLGSRNGTWLNGERLIPEKPYPLANGARVQLGRMRTHLFHRAVSSSQQP